MESSRHDQGSTSAQNYRFGDFRIDLGTRELYRGDTEIKVPPKSLGCLFHLIEHRDRAVSRDELIDVVWGHDHLSDGVLAQTIFQLRRALDDNDGARFVKTIRGFGYRWIAEPESEPELGDLKAPSTSSLMNEAPSPGRLARTSTALFAIIVGILAIAALLHFFRSPATTMLEPIAEPRVGELALLLPIQSEDESEHSWIRLGLMDLIGNRLREAGQAVVPSETVIALLRSRSTEPETELGRQLAIETGSQVVVSGQARRAGQRWTVTLRTAPLHGPSRSVLGEDGDVLTAARLAADRLAAELGLTPADQRSDDADALLLLQRTEAALLSQRFDDALALIEQADSGLQQHPEIRLQRARIAYQRLDLDTAQAGFESLISDPEARERPRLVARAMSGLATVHGVQGRFAESRALMEEAVARFDEAEFPETLGIIRMNLGLLFQEQGDFATAREHLARAQHILQGTGNVLSQAVLANNLGAMETRGDRYAEALRHYQRALRGFVAVQSVAGELYILAAMIDVHLALLDTPAAASLEARMLELLPLNGHRITAAYAGLSRANLLAALGRDQEAEIALDQALDAMAGHRELEVSLGVGRAMKAHQRWLQGHPPEEYATLAAAVVEELAPHPHVHERRALAWLLKVRGALASARLDDADVSAQRLQDWADSTGAIAARVHAAVARAEVAKAQGRSEQTESSYRQALTLAESSHAPIRLLQVAQSQVHWLLEHPDREREILLLDNRLSGYSDRHFEVAVLRLRIAQALGPASAWRSALVQAQDLAGERSIPPDLLVPPHP